MVEKLSEMLPIRLLFAPFLVFVLLCGCNTTQFLDKSKGEQYLKKNELVVDESRGKLRGKANILSELTNLYVKRENGKMFGVPRRYHYFVAQDTFDKSKIGLAFSKRLAKMGEEPVYVDSLSCQQTVDAMRAYLQTRGYFFANVTYEIKSNKDKTVATVVYTVLPDSRFVIDKLEYQSKDTAVLRVLNEISGASLLKPGSAVDVKLYDQEVSRITRYLRDHGYADFYPQYISNLEGFDSSNVNKTVSIRLNVLTPTKQEAHKKYIVGNIYVFPDYDPSMEGIKPDTLIDGLFFGTGGREFRVRPRTLANSIYLRSGDVYNQEALDNSIRQLGSLGVFRPPTLQTVEDTLHPGNLDFFIYLTGNKKWEVGLDWGANFTERSTLVSRRILIGLSLNPSLRNKNFLRGAELYVGNLNFGTELNFFDGGKNLINSLDFNWQNDLYMPRFADYFGLWKKARDWGITSESFNKNLWQKATTRASAGYNHLNLLGNYKLHFVNLSYGYEVPVSINHRVTINHFGLDIVVPKIVEGSLFDQLLDSNPALRTSFSKQFITGLLVRDVNFIYTSPPKPTGSSWFFRGYFDLSGLEVMAANAAYNAISGENAVFKVSEVDFSHYAKLELDLRRYWNFTTNRNLIARANLGIALPFYHSEEVPYVKQFFVGGPYGIRGWYTRELGPGLYRDPNTDDSNRNLFYQAGDLKIEMNLEYRFLLTRPFGLFNLFGAVFLDGGNIWTQRYDESRPGSRFTVKKSVKDGEIVEDVFWKEMAVSTGFGFRMDFSYLILRLDLGTPIRNNYPDPLRNNTYLIDPKNWEINNFGDVFRKFHKNTSYQLAINYPF